MYTNFSNSDSKTPTSVTNKFAIKQRLVDDSNCDRSPDASSVLISMAQTIYIMAVAFRNHIDTGFKKTLGEDLR